MEMRHGILSRLLVGMSVWSAAALAWAAPSNTMSVTPACTSGTTITCSDETTRNNNISTPYNAHSHTDIAAMTGVNTFTIGDGTLGNKDYCEDGTTDRCIRYNSAADLWTVQQGSTNYNQILVYSGTAGISSGRVLASDGTGAVVALTAATPSDDAALVGDSATAATWRAVPNCNTSTTALQYTTATNSFSCGTVGATAPVFGRVSLTSNVTTTSTTLTDVTGATVTLTTGAFPVLIGFTANCAHSSATEYIYMNADVDGTALLGSTGNIEKVGVANEERTCGFVVETAALSAASHTFKARWRVEAAGTATIRGDSGVSPMFWVQEIR